MTAVTVDCVDPNDCNGPPPPEECVILYSECNYEGHNVRICEDTPFADFDFEV